MVLLVPGGMFPVAVGRFDEHRGGALGFLAAAQHRMLVASQVAGEQHRDLRVVGQPDPDARRSEDVPGAGEARMHPAAQVEVAVEGDVVEQRQGALDVGLVVERQWRIVLGIAAPCGVAGLVHLQVRRVAQHDGGEFAGLGRAVDASVEAVLDQGGNVATVVHVGMGDEQVGDRRRVHREVVPIATTPFPGTLEHAGVNHEPALIEVEQEL